jgi:LacI family transcriptional regulator
LSLPSLEEVAKLAGVSQDTASRILNRNIPTKRKDALERADRVKAVAKELGYLPNVAAQALGRGSFNTISLLTGSASPNWVAPGIISGALNILNAQHIHLLLERIPVDSIKQTNKFPSFLQSLSCDGLLIHEVSFMLDVTEKIMSRANIPLVWVNHLSEKNSVYFDDYAATVTGVERLLEMGHKRICYLDMGSSSHASIHERKSGYMSAMNNVGLKPYTCRCDYAEVMMESESLTAADVLEKYISEFSENERPTAFLAYSNFLSNALTTAATRLGLRIPQDISIIAFAENQLNVGEKLDLLGLNYRKMGEEAAKLLLKRISNPKVDLESVCIPIVLEEGRTVMPLKSPTK